MSKNLIDFMNDDAPPPIPANPPPTISHQPGQYIIVPQRVINIVDIKFEEDPFLVTLHGIMTPETYKFEIERINVALHESRATLLDHALLFSGPAILPLIPWAIRSKTHKKKRRRIIEYCAIDFNSRNPSLRMIWKARPEKMLMIWLREDAEAEMSR